jgi:hypothetical protein
MAASNWKVTLYAANTDTASTTYDTVATSNIAALGASFAYTTTTFFITGSRATWEIESSSLEDISGSRRGTSSRRRVFEIESFPFAFTNNAGDQDIDVIDQIAEIVDSRSFLWARVEAGSRTYPSTSATAHPVVVNGWEESINDDAGTRHLTLSLAHRFKL